MPLEIGQLVINARVVPESGPSASVEAATSQDNQEHEHILVEKCVAEVLRVLEERLER